MTRDTRRMMIANVVVVGCLTCIVAIAMSVRPTDAAQDDQPSLDELLQLLPLPRSAPDREDIPIRQGNAQGVGADVLQQLADGQPADMFDRVVHEMDQAADRMDLDVDIGLETQRLQESILAKLDQVIAAARKSGLGSGSGGAGSPGGPAQQQETGSEFNVAQGGDPSHGDSQGTAGGGSGSGGSQSSAAQDRQGPLQEHRQRWGNLPPRLRDDLLQGLNERFSSVYRELTGQYYRRLAQEGQE